MKITIINGPNLNLLGTREPGIYGDKPFEGFLKELQKKYPEVEFTYFQSNVEGIIIDKLQENSTADGIILNAGGYTHTSVAIGDAIAAIKAPVIEVHITNIFARESSRHISMIGAQCRGTISGFGLRSYELAVMAFLEK
jgi:3-dehydroquinate dehydratase II